MDYDIIQLHENTYYNICIELFYNLTSVIHREDCVEATTATDSLHVALGSTFGAFLALGVIVFFVFLAKWQHTRRQQQQLELNMSPSGNSYDSLPQKDGFEMSDVSMQVHEDTTRIEFSSQSSQLSTANGMVHQAMALPDEERLSEQPTAMNGDIQGAAGGGHYLLPSMSIDSGNSTDLLVPHSIAPDVMQVSTIRNGKPVDVRPKILEPKNTDRARVHEKPPVYPGGRSKPVEANPQAHQVQPDKDVWKKTPEGENKKAPDVRPKEYGKGVGLSDIRTRNPALIDITNAFSRSMCVPEPTTNSDYDSMNPQPTLTLKPNLSCNW